MTRGRVQVVVLVGLALAVGFLVGTWRAGATMESGRADSTANGGGSIITDGWTYGFPADVAWTDTTNRFHPDGPRLSSAAVICGWPTVCMGWRVCRRMGLAPSGLDRLSECAAANSRTHEVMEPQPGVFVTSLSTDDWEPDPTLVA